MQVQTYRHGGVSGNRNWSDQIDSFFVRFSFKKRVKASSNVQQLTATYEQKEKDKE